MSRLANPLSPQFMAAVSQFVRSGRTSVDLAQFSAATDRIEIPLANHGNFNKPPRVEREAARAVREAIAASKEPVNEHHARALGLQDRLTAEERAAQLATGATFAEAHRARELLAERKRAASAKAPASPPPRAVRGTITAQDRAINDALARAGGWTRALTEEELQAAADIRARRIGA